ncbi:hypothetical protein SDC9_93720 [bioreactor metagenome]|uniref:N-acetyltransferase domain-containing protein n=1 Tax=bioreactor metagenome TaxID=1076179 RepID=A0A645A1U5_9ZZZZ
MNFDSGDSCFYKNDEDENLICEISYSMADNNMISIDRTFVNDDYCGQGIAAQLVDCVVKMAREENKKLYLAAPSLKAC